MKILTAALAGLVCATSPIAHAGIDEALAAYQGGKYRTALKQLQPLASKGDAVAEYHLGLMYRDASGVKRNVGKAAAHFRRAADAGNAAARCALGNLLSEGQGLPQDHKQAAHWYRLAAEQGHAEAQFKLGLAYATGTGVFQDYKAAIDWYRLSADQGLHLAMNRLGDMFSAGRGVAENPIVAYALFNLSGAIDSSSQNSAIGKRNDLVKMMTSRQTEAGQTLTREMARPGNLVTALDRYIAETTEQ